MKVKFLEIQRSGKWNSKKIAPFEASVLWKKTRSGLQYLYIMTLAYSNSLSMLTILNKDESNHEITSFNAFNYNI